eukprot:TRINITY_DN4878_c0_g1_i1.p1 TRINITY_DN4878_c0_g1~~TRINITY_DN4878_c0_g1_i1.p1  ORF type:complete len:1021 (-),score=283.22 TRINITY_DN4878_c0_g1_i1:115-3123(-)
MDGLSESHLVLFVGVLTLGLWGYWHFFVKPRRISADPEFLAEIFASKPHKKPTPKKSKKPEAPRRKKQDIESVSPLKDTQPPSGEKFIELEESLEFIDFVDRKKEYLAKQKEKRAQQTQALKERGASEDDYWHAYHKHMYTNVNQGYTRYLRTDPLPVMEKKRSAKEIARLMRGERDYLEVVKVYLPPLPEKPTWRIRTKSQYAPTPACVTRLIHDLREIQDNPLPNVAATPSYNNIQIWHCNLRPTSGPYAGVIFHLELDFPNNYPKSPPELFMYTPIPHPNIYDGYICLDMLSYTGSYYDGWTSAYTVQAILQQLQTFMIAESVEQGWDTGYDQVNQVEYVDASKERIDAFKCKLCEHCYEQNYPELPPYKPDEAWISPVEAGFMSPVKRDRDNCLNVKDCSKNVTISEDGMTVKCEMPKGWWGVRSVKGYAIGGKFSNKTVYFEVLISGTGVSRIGFSTRGGRYNLGTDDRGFGFGGTGKKSHKNVFADYGTGYRKGDIVGCALDLNNGNIIYWRNGLCQGVAFSQVETADFKMKLLYPTISMRNMEVTVNFGADGYRYMPEQIKWPKGFPDPREDLFASTIQETPPVRRPDVSSKYFPKVTTQILGKFDPTLPRSKQPWVPMGNHNFFEDVGMDILQEILLYSDAKELVVLKRVCKVWRHVIRSRAMISKLSLQCFSTKVDYRHSVLGFGIRTEVCVEEKFQVEKKTEKEKAKEIPPKSWFIINSTDLLSYDAFKSGTRYGAWGDSFDIFFPLVVGEGQYMKSRVLLVLKRTISEMARKIQKSNAFDFNLNHVPVVLGHVMNGFFPGSQNTVLRYLYYYHHLGYTRKFMASERAIQGFCWLHRTFLEFQDELNLKEICTDKIDEFMKNPDEFVGPKTTNRLQDVLVFLLFSKQTFDDISETFIRKTRTPSREIEDYSNRMECVFMFKYLTLVGRPKNCSVAEVQQNFRQSFGDPSEAHLAELLAFIKKFAEWYLEPTNFPALGRFDFEKYCATGELPV